MSCSHCKSLNVFFGGMCEPCYDQTFKVRTGRRYAPCHPDRPVVARDMCNSCYYVKGSPDKKKASCHPDVSHHAKGFCKPCYEKSKDPDGVKSKARARKHYKENWEKYNEPSYVRSGNLKRKYGITQEDYTRLLNDQGGVCAFCKSTDTGIGAGSTEKRAFAVDHCHTTGKVRALLCHRCNPGLGYFRDNPELLRKAIAYLERYSQLGPTKVRDTEPPT